MGILDTLLGRKTEALEFKQQPMVGYFGVGSSNEKKMNYSDLAIEGYLRNAIVYRCVNEVSKGASAAEQAESTTELQRVFQFVIWLPALGREQLYSQASRQYECSS